MKTTGFYLTRSQYLQQQNTFLSFLENMFVWSFLQNKTVNNTYCQLRLQVWMLDYT